MKTIVLASAIVLAPALAFAMGCKNGSHETAASCPTGQVWDSEASQCVDQPTG